MLLLLACTAPPKPDVTTDVQPKPIMQTVIIDSIDISSKIPYDYLGLSNHTLGQTFIATHKKIDFIDFLASDGSSDTTDIKFRLYLRENDGTGKIIDTSKTLILPNQFNFDEKEKATVSSRTSYWHPVPIRVEMHSVDVVPGQQYFIDVFSVNHVALAVNFTESLDFYPAGSWYQDYEKKHGDLFFKIGHYDTITIPVEH